MNKQPITDNYDFEYLIHSGANYVDKTGYLHQLVTGKSTCFFLSRPRRFGKSLTISTLKQLFRGRRELFTGLTIDAMGYDWRAYPVVHLNMAEMDATSAMPFTEGIRIQLAKNATALGIELLTTTHPGYLFEDLLRKAAASTPTGKVVLLIDEYDAPLVNNIDQPHLEEIRAILENFYSQIKSLNEILRFTFMTGVTRFSKVSVFSKLNHMVDLSMDLDYATMLGYTQEELDLYFGERMEELAKKRGIGVEALKQKIKVWYNGYRFHPLASTLYNPVSIGRFLTQNEFENWWFETGSPSFLMKQLRKKPINYFDLLHKPVGRELINSFDPARIEARSLLFQTGYLTIASAENEDDTGWWYTLGFPNKEVELSLSTYLAAELGAGDTSESLYAARTLARMIRRGDTAGIFETLHAHLAAIPYDALALNEGNFKSLLFLLFRMAGVIVSAEHYTNKGRVDLVIEAPEHYYIFEYKYNQSAAEAMAQIHHKGYYEQFLNQGKQIHLVALNYDPKQRNIGSDRFEELL